MRKSSTSGPRGVSWETACPQSVGFCCNLNVFLKCHRQGSCLAPVVCWFELLPEMSKQVHLRVSWDLRAHTHAHVSASVQPSGLLLWLSSLMTLQDLGNQSLQGKLKPCLCSVPFHRITSWTQAAHREAAGWPGGHLSPHLGLPVCPIFLVASGAGSTDSCNSSFAVGIWGVVSVGLSPSELPVSPLPSAPWQTEPMAGAVVRAEL